MKNIKPFGPSLGRYKLTNKFVNNLNNKLDSKNMYQL